MTRFAPPSGDPHALREAARRLATTGADLDLRGAAVAAATVASTSAWSGTAAVQALARTRELRRSAAEARELLERTSRATARYADDVERARESVARLERQWQDGAERVRRTAADEERRPVALAAWQQESAELQRRYDAVDDELGDRGLDLERALRERDPVALLPGWAAGGVRTAQAGVRAYGLVVTRGVAWARYSSLVLQASRWFDLGDARVGGALLRSGEATALRSALFGAPRSGTLGGVRTVLGRAFLPLSLAAGVQDVRTGGGYGGVRGGVTRVAGAVGAGGATALLASSAGALTLGPVGLAVVGAAVIGYGLYGLGSFVYDHREVIGEFLSRTGRGIAVAATTARDAVGRAASTVAAEARERVDGALETGRRVLGVVTTPARLLPSLGGLF